MRFSIIIPTLNEERYIGDLLKCLSTQTFRNFEVLIIDAKSRDKTKDVVLKYEESLNIRFIESPKKSISYQRNLGAKLSSYDDLIFFDADVTIEPQFINKVMEHIKKNNPDLLCCWFNPISKRVDDKFYFQMTNSYLEAVKKISPRGGGAFMYIKKKPFFNIGGFPEDIVLGEDYELVRRMNKEGYKYSLIKDPRINVSVRRFDKQGRIPYIINILFADLLVLLKGPIKDNRVIKYEFGNFNEEILSKNRNKNKMNKRKKTKKNFSWKKIE